MQEFSAPILLRRLRHCAHSTRCNKQPPQRRGPVRRRKITLADLINEPWTWSPPGGVIHSSVVNAFRASGLEPPRPTILTEAINVRARLAATRGFLTVAYASMLTFPAKHEWLRPLAVELPNTHLPVGMIRLKNRTLSPLAQLFIECARDIAKSLAKRKQ